MTEEQRRMVDLVLAIFRNSKAKYYETHRGHAGDETEAAMMHNALLIARETGWDEEEE